MPFGRMQLHPSDSERAAMRAVQSLGAGFIGLGFRNDPGDLKLLGSNLPEGVTAQDMRFANDMAIGDKVLVIVHNYPFALATVSGEYNYIRVADPKLRIWFRHF